MKYTSKNTNGIYIKPVEVTNISIDRIDITDGRYTSPLNDQEGCLCSDLTYSIDCCEGRVLNQGIGSYTGVKIKKGSFSFGFSNGFEIY